MLPMLVAHHHGSRILKFNSATKRCALELYSIVGVKLLIYLYEILFNAARILLNASSNGTALFETCWRQLQRRKCLLIFLIVKEFVSILNKGAPSAKTFPPFILWELFDNFSAFSLQFYDAVANTTATSHFPAHLSTNCYRKCQSLNNNSFYGSSKNNTVKPEYKSHFSIFRTLYYAALQ